MPSTQVPKNYLLINDDDAKALIAGNPIIQVEIFKPKPNLDSNQCNFGDAEIHNIQLTQVYLEPEDIAAGWERGGLLHIAFHCRRQYKSEINPELRFRF